MHSLARVQTAALQPVPEVVARRWQAEKAARVAFFAQMFAGSAASWFLFALGGFATCCEVWAERGQPEPV